MDAVVVEPGSAKGGRELLLLPGSRPPALLLARVGCALPVTEGEPTAPVLSPLLAAFTVCAVSAARGLDAMSWVLAAAFAALSSGLACPAAIGCLAGASACLCFCFAPEGLLFDAASTTLAAAATLEEALPWEARRSC